MKESINPSSPAATSIQFTPAKRDDYGSMIADYETKIAVAGIGLAIIEAGDPTSEFEHTVYLSISLTVSSLSGTDTLCGHLGAWASF